MAVLVVLTGILVFRLNPFLALLAAALLVAALTPRAELRKYAEQQQTKQDWTQKQASNFIDKQTFATRVATGFGETCGKIGILIAMASIIGRCLLDSGAADRIVNSVARLLGQARMGISFVFSGFLLGIPVFFDTVFYLMIPLGRAAARSEPSRYLFFVLTIVAGATMAHSLVPPTPGPLIVVDQFGVDLFQMIVGGTIVGLISSSAGYLLAAWAKPKSESRVAGEAASTEAKERETKDDSFAEQRLDRGPPLFLSLLPILLPVLLIGGATVGKLAARSTSNETVDTDTQTATEVAHALLRSVGDKNVALGIAAVLSIFLVLRWSKLSWKEASQRVQESLMSAGTIILITAAGGAFGTAIRQCGIAGLMTELVGESQPIWLLPIAFGLTTLIRTAQGSATVAMVTAAGVLQDFAQQESLSFNVLYLALAVGCGSKPVAWMADSGFWVICRMSGMTERQGLQTVTPMSIVMGLTGLVATMLGALLFPLK